MKKNNYEKDSLVKIGKITSVFGIKGQVKIYLYTDDVSNILKKNKFFLEDNGFLNIISSKCYKDNIIIVSIDGINSANDASKLVNKYIYTDVPSYDKLEKNTYYIKDLIGMKVYENGKIIGTLSYVFNTGANDIYEVILENSSKKIYIPVISQVIKNIDLDKKIIDVLLMEGLI